ncbi:MAG: ABC transporter permease [Kiritimatiellae bacterium]|nr:ABC transporter permease [Kiritimatiellia bacterium]
MLALIKQIHRHRELLLILMLRNLKIRYKSSVLGFFWTLLSPIFLIGIYAVFLRILRFPIDLPILVTGIIAWQFLAMCLGDSLHAVLGNANLVRKTASPRIVFPLAMVMANVVNLLLSLVVLFAYLLVTGARIGNLAWLPLIVLTQFALCCGMSLLLSCANVFFRDTEHILSVVLLAWFFLTPVIYPIDSLLKWLEKFPMTVQRLAFANPMTGIVTAYRCVFLSSDIMAPRRVTGSCLIAWLILVIGAAVFQRFQTRFADEL